LSLAAFAAGIVWLGLVLPAWADPRAQVRGDLTTDLRQRLAQAIGETTEPPTNRFEARRRARGAMEAAEALLRSEGYYQSVLEDDVEGEDHPVAIVNVRPGPRFTLAPAAIQWTAPEPEPEVIQTARAEIGLTTGDAGRAAEVVAAEGRIIASLTRQGYPDAATEPRRVVVDHAARRRPRRALRKRPPRTCKKISC
jgi:translocation and assembly module TamA